MRRLAKGCLLSTAFVALGPAQPSAAQDASRVRSEVATTMETAAEKMIALAEAMPEEAYAWRPSEGVRSVSEVYMHVVG
ncbi:MAG: hypothetical protein ACR2QM_18275, partial [Longimicrobiales bacterium]